MVGTAELRFRVRLELDGRADSVSQEAVGNLNAVLAKISNALSFK